MGKTRNKTLTSTALIILLAFISIFATMLSANAEVLEIDTFLHVMVAPNPVGVTQQVQVTVQLDKVSPTALGVYGGDHFTDFRVEISKPDGTTDSMGPYEAWATSGFFFMFTPDQVGTYTLQANFPGQWINTTRDNYFKPSTSKAVELTVQADPITDYQANVMSQDEYWERPIYGENKGWFRGTDNWLMQDYDKTSRSFCVSTAFAPYTAAPDSAHILWKKPIIFGGNAGGKYGDMSYYTGLSYEQFYLPLILEGRIYYVEHGPTTGTTFGTRVLDLYSGEEIFFLNNTAIDFIQIYDIENPNEHGLIAHLWSTSGPSVLSEGIPKFGTNQLDKVD